MIALFSSCQTSRHFLIRDAKWGLETEENFQVLNDSTTGDKFFYHAISLDRAIRGEIPMELFSLPRLKESIEINPGLKPSDLDDLTKSVLKSVGFNIQSDTLYFIVRGNIIAFWSPEYDRKSATNAIIYNPNIGWDIEKTPMKGVKDPSELNDEDIFRTLYYYPRKKQYLIRDCFQANDGYLNFVYIFQSRTNRNKKTNPREWCCMWDVTSPQNIFYTVQLLNSAKAISIKNRQLFAIQAY